MQGFTLEAESWNIFSTFAFCRVFSFLVTFYGFRTESVLAIRIQYSYTDSVLNYRTCGVGRAEGAAGRVGGNKCQQGEKTFYGVLHFFVTRGLEFFSFSDWNAFLFFS